MGVNYNSDESISEKCYIKQNLDFSYTKMEQTESHSTPNQSEKLVAFQIWYTSIRFRNRSINYM